MRIAPLTLTLAVALGLAAAACGGAVPEPGVPDPATDPNAALPAPPASAAPVAPTAAPAAPAAPAGPVAFSTLTNTEAKVAHMKTFVMPAMTKVFQEGDAKKYDKFGCGTCHGEKKQDPHVVLPKLTLSGDGMKKLTASKPAVMKFMMEKVTPAMVAAMGEKPYDMATHKGFGCGGCHKVD